MERAATQSQRLRTIIALTSGRLSECIRQMWMHPRLGELYPEFLFALYGVVKASAPLLRFAAQEAERLKLEDPVAEQLAGYFLEHAEEESGHDVWLLDDLARLGFDQPQVFDRLAYTSVANLVGSQYFLAAHAHPAAILGYLAVLENPAAPEFFEAVAGRTGVPTEAMSTLLKHARLDIEHLAEFDRMLDALPFTGKQSDIMTRSAISCVAQLEAFFEEILERFDRIDDARLQKGVFYRQSKPVQDACQEVEGLFTHTQVFLPS